MSIPPLHPPLDPAELQERLTQWAHEHGPSNAAHTPPAPQNGSPISSLPPELLSEVFIGCLPDDQYPAPDITAAPILPMHVCKSWRNVARHTPELWSSLQLNYRCAEEDVPATELWLRNSGDLPLSLSLSIDFHERPHQAILNLVSRYAKRWKHVRFEFRNLSCPAMYNLATALDNVTMLSTFEFHARDVSTSNIAPITQLLSSAPNLKELTWVDDLADTATMLALPLSRLARLSLSMSYGKLDYLGLLDQCANLEHIRIAHPYPETNPSQTPLFLPKLTSLNITHDLTGILNYLILPSLKHVRVHLDSAHHSSSDNEGRRYSRLALAGIHPGASASATAAGTEERGSWDPTNLLHLIERSSCRIESLKVNTKLSPADLLRCLKACSGSLRSLTLPGGPSISALVDMLIPGGSPLQGDDSAAGCLCPRLEELVIHTRIPSTCSLLELVRRRMERSRGDGLQADCSPLKSLRLHYPAGHKDIASLRDIAFVLNSQKRGSLDLRIVEMRMGNLRGSSAAGRMHPLHLQHRRKASSASR